MAVINLVFGIFYIIEGILTLTGTITLTPISIACACFCAGFGFFNLCLDYFKED